jgi:adenosylcobinamide kinase / adenosylcobinamide-phosphate guanylyltransferase
MPLVVLLGGARSGKSQLAVELAAATGAPVTFVATGEARDDEMAARIEEHRRARPTGWVTIEEPYRLRHALEQIDGSSVAVLDCLSLWVANALERGDDPDAIIASSRQSAELAAARAALTVTVSNEVGLGIVPATPLGRLYRDLLGSVNRIWVSAAAEAVLVIAGRGLPLADVPALLGAGSSASPSRPAS